MVMVMTRGGTAEVDINARGMNEATFAPAATMIMATAMVVTTTM